MAEQIFRTNSGFFNSVDNDRLYNAEQMNKPYKRIVANGVFATPAGTPSTDLQTVSAVDGMKIIVKAGEGLFDNKWFENPSDITIIVPSNTSLFPRRDSVIVQVDNRISERRSNIVYREGTPATNPLPPDIGTVEGVVEYRVANIYVAAGASVVNDDAIRDLRGSSECPWVTGVIQQVDTSTLYNQWNAAFQHYYDVETVAFNEFMSQLTEQLTVSTNVATFESHYTSVSTVSQIPINIAGFDKNRDVLMVYVNRLRATPDIDYTIAFDNSYITLTTSITAGQSVNFLVLKSIVGADDEPIMELLNSINNKLTGITTDSGWINFTLENGATAFDATTTPAIRKYNNQVFIRGAVKNIDTLSVAICTLPSAMRPAMNIQYPVTAFANGVIAANCVLEITTAGVLKIVAKSGSIPVDNMLPISINFIV